LFNGLDDDYLSDFVSDSEDGQYSSFQDFFTRKLVSKVNPKFSAIWPCEGYVCEQGKVSELPVVTVKGQSRNLKEIFGAGQNQIPGDFYYTNIFLHNHNYHRIHAPVEGTVTRIERVPGELSILRPWVYSFNEVSKPALRNERVNIDILDQEGRPWFLSIVGGMGVGTIKLMDIVLGSKVRAGDEIALFLLGSTCCMVSPVKPSDKNYLEIVRVGQSLAEV
jgi:phosphatidylserine decarboxylase